jgi:hypothetical protein
MNIAQSINSENTDENQIPTDSTLSETNDQTALYFSGFIKIFDPNTGQILLKKRNDE